MTFTARQLEQAKRQLRNKSRIIIKRLGDWTDAKGVITLARDDGTITIERTVERQSRREDDLTQSPLYTTPDKYKNKKKCNVCLKYINLCNFSADPRNLDGKQGTCKQCRAKLAKDNYTPRWKR